MRHGFRYTKFYSKWASMKGRCNRKSRSDYNTYGGRGITYTPRWEKFENFKEDMYESYLDHVEKYGERNTTLDRIDVNGNYCKENCRWATVEEQNRNQTSNIYVNIDGEVLTVSSACKRFNVPLCTGYWRVHNGRDIFGNKH